jgi:hypothetical protein
MSRYLIKFDIKVNRFGSFAPIRDQSICKWFIDGENYFIDVL